MAETDSRTKGQGPRRNHRPRLTIVIGTNGAGKSTWCSKHENELPAAFYDADSIANSLGDWNDPHNQILIFSFHGAETTLAPGVAAHDQGR